MISATVAVEEETLSGEEIAALGEAIAETAAFLDAATHRFLTQLRAFDRARGWERSGAVSSAHWLSWRIGMDLGAARERVRVARKLAEVPAIDHALAGSISYSKVRAMTRIASATNQDELVTMARTMTGAQLERFCRLARQVESLAGQNPRDVEDTQRYVSSRRTDDGMVAIQIRLHPEEAARVMKAFEVASATGNLADGAVALAESALAGADAIPSERPVRSPVEVVVHISADTLTGETELGDGVSAETARRLLCDAGIVPMLEDARGHTIDVGRKTRTIPAALARALRSRDRGCRFPGCANTRFVDAHHLVHWLNGGDTSLANTILLCRRHHRYLHEYGFTAEIADDEVVFRDSSGRVIPPHGERPPRLADPLDWLRTSLVEHGASIAAATNEPEWDGQRIDLDLCIAALSLTGDQPPEAALRGRGAPARLRKLRQRAGRGSPPEFD